MAYFHNGKRANKGEKCNGGVSDISIKKILHTYVKTEYIL